MSAEVLDGKKISKEIQAEIKERVAAFVATFDHTPTLAAVLVGEDPASQVYVRNKERACERAGIHSQLFRMSAQSTTEDVLELVQQLNEDPAVNGILVQLPLPPSVDSQVVLDAVHPIKDVDAFHPTNVGLISQGRPQFLPCTPHGIIQMLKRYGIQANGKNVVIVGRSDIVGKPMALMLANRDIGLGPEMANATVTLCHSRTSDLKAMTRMGDILIAAMGQPEFITGDMVKPGAVVVDVGINRTDAGLVGDVDYEGVLPVASYLTPVPGGVGPLTVTMLLENTLTATGLQRAAISS
ncbi:MAG: bifunctional methylenetetrahydrofolate dehydrogenase/methenyltetrahydrofolate cyclohydrolase FolD [Mariniblastus sp.]|nr:bifunctional methylenetetrahydrofolate dehydrogenase/methenyltetrahydrofolate cyclohydrolase FolD [Mariniblastus sp.]